MRLLLVEDDRALGQGIRVALSNEGYTLDWLQDGVSALHALRSESFDLLLLDLGLPRLDGLALLQQLRASQHDLPVLILTARDGTAERIAGLDAGADDYLIKPFALEELLARCRALLRRTAAETPVTETLITIGDLVIDPRSRDVSRGGVPISLAAREYDLLLFLARQAGRVVSRGEILENVWGPNFFGDGNVLDVYIRYLRQKIEQPERQQLIHTYRGVGYMLRANDDA